MDFQGTQLQVMCFGLQEVLYGISGVSSCESVSSFSPGKKDSGYLRKLLVICIQSQPEVVVLRHVAFTISAIEAPAEASCRLTRSQTDAV